MLSTVEKLLFLKGIDLFQKLSNEDLVQIAQIAEEVHFEREEPLIVEGDMGDALFITVAGHVRISKEGKKLNELGGGEVLGEMGILDSAPRSASVTAIDDVTVLKLERDAFHELMSERQEIAQGIIHVLLHRLRALSQIKADEIQKARGATPIPPSRIPANAPPSERTKANSEGEPSDEKPSGTASEDVVSEVAEAIGAAGVDVDTAVELAAEASDAAVIVDDAATTDAVEAADAPGDSDASATTGAPATGDASDAVGDDETSTKAEGAEQDETKGTKHSDGEGR